MSHCISAQSISFCCDKLCSWIYFFKVFELIKCCIHVFINLSWSWSSFDLLTSWCCTVIWIVCLVYNSFFSVRIVVCEVWGFKFLFLSVSDLHEILFELKLGSSEFWLKAAFFFLWKTSLHSFWFNVLMNEVIILSVLVV